MTLSPMLEGRRSEAAAKAAVKAQAAKTAINSAGQSAKVAVNSLWKKLPTAHWRPGHAAFWKPSKHSDDCSLPTSSCQLRHADEYDWALSETSTTLSQDDLLSLPPSEVSLPCSSFNSAASTTLSLPCSSFNSEFLFPSESESAVDKSVLQDQYLVSKAKQLPICSLSERRKLWQLQFSAEEVADLEESQWRVPARIAHQIELDVPRTRSSSMSESDRETLQHVLSAYATIDPVVGYCQGMSDIAAVFVLQGFDKSASLRGLCSILQSCCPDYFCPSLEGYVRDMAALQVLAREILSSETAQMLDSLDAPLTMLAADHFLTLASHTWPLEAVERLWDLFLVEGSPAVFASFLALLDLYLPRSNQLERAMDGPEKVNIFMKAVSKGVVEDLDSILEQTRQLILRIPMSRIQSLRTNAQTLI